MSSSKKQNINDEDSYLRQIDSIIERDFFPDSELISVENAYIEAEMQNDFETMNNLQHRRKQLMKKNPKLSMLETPASERFMPDTPKLEDATPKKELVDEKGNIIPNDDFESEDPNENSTVTLNGYLSKNTSEDNYQYHQVTRAVDHKKHLAKYRWVYELDNKHRKYVPYATVDSGLGIEANKKLKEQQRQLAIEYKGKDAVKEEEEDEKEQDPSQKQSGIVLRGDESLYKKPKDADHQSKIINNWRYVSKNNVMFYQEAIGSKYDDGKFKKPQQINYAATRFKEKDPYAKQIERMRIEKASQLMMANKAGQFQKDGSTVNKDGSWTPTALGLSKTGRETPGHTPNKVHSFGNAGDTPMLSGLNSLSAGTPGTAYVPSTPVVTPGQGADSTPLMTWGTLGNTPTALTPGSTPRADSNGSRYILPGVTKREVMADKLLNKVKVRERQKELTAKNRARKNLLGKTPDRLGSVLSGNTTRRNFTPAAQSLALKLGTSRKGTSGGLSSGASPMVRLGTTSKRTSGSGGSMVAAKLSKLNKGKVVNTPGYTPSVTSNLL